MCGIAGYASSLRWNDEAMLKSLSHRGPDGNGSIVLPVEDKFAVLLHHRLSIIDLSEKGAQPMSLPSGLHIAFNGEIYNYKVLKKKFLEGYSFFSETDTEVLLRLWEKLGPDCLKELNGDFAFTIVDERDNSMFLVRDRMGVKPLYYTIPSSSGLLFGSEIKSIMHAGYETEIDQQILPLYLFFKYVPGDLTLYKNIKRVKPGSFLKIDLRSFSWSENIYWTPKKEILYNNKKDAEEELKQLVQDSVRLRLHADVPVCNLLSGGIDSSIIASQIKDYPEVHHYCAAKSSVDLKAEGTTSDFYHAEKLALDWKLKLHKIEIGKETLNIELLKKTLYFGDDLIADGSQIPTFLIANEASKKARVALSGMGADELFLGYAGHILALLALYLDKLPGFISNYLCERFKALHPGVGNFKAFKRYLFKLGNNYNNPHRLAAFSVVGDMQSALSLTTGSEEVVVDFLENYFSNSQDPFDSLFDFERENFLVKNLHYVDRMCMANGMEARVPFLDHRIVEFSQSIPREWKLDRFGRGKRILTSAFKDDLPDHIVNRRKAGFGMPLRSLLSDPATLQQFIGKEKLNQQYRINNQMVNELVSKHISGKEDQSALLWALVVLSQSGAEIGEESAIYH